MKFSFCNFFRKNQLTNISIIIFLSLLSIQMTLSNKLKKQHYSFINEPIDIVIPCVQKDSFLLNQCIHGIQMYCENIRRIIVVSPKKYTDEAEWFDESNFPFTMNQVAEALTKSIEDRQEFLEGGKGRCGWYFQQLLKLYSPYVIPCISSNVLVVDADVIFLNSVRFQDEKGAPLLNVGRENHKPYFSHMNRLLPGLHKQLPKKSGVVHWMLFQRPVLDDLFKSVEEIHQKEFWKAFCNCVDAKELHGSGASEYEIYFNFILSRSSQATIQKLDWLNVSSVKSLEEYKERNIIYIACHDYMREGS